MWEEQVSEQKWIHIVQQGESLSDQHSFVQSLNLSHFKAWEIELTGKAVGWSAIEMLQGGVHRVTRLYVYSVLCCETLWLEQQSPVSLTSWNATMLSCPLSAQMFDGCQQKLNIEAVPRTGSRGWLAEPRQLVLVWNRVPVADGEAKAQLGLFPLQVLVWVTWLWKWRILREEALLKL